MASGIFVFSDGDGNFRAAKIGRAKEVIYLFMARGIGFDHAFLVGRPVGITGTDDKNGTEILLDGCPVGLIEITAQNNIIILLVLI